MTNLIETNELLDLALKINTAAGNSIASYDGAIANVRKGLEYDREIGELLIRSKMLLPHGDFTGWVEYNCDFGMRQAQRRMWLTRNWEKVSGRLAAEFDTEPEFGGRGLGTKCVMRDAFDIGRLTSLTSVISLCTPKLKEEASTEPVKKKIFRVVAKEHELLGEDVEMVNESSQGEVIVCKTTLGNIPFLRKELADPESAESTQILDAEVIEKVVEENEERLNKIREAIALIIEYLPEVELKAILSQSISLGKEHLPSDVATNSSRLLIGTSGNESLMPF